MKKRLGVLTLLAVFIVSIAVSTSYALAEVPEQRMEYVIISESAAVYSTPDGDVIDKLKKGNIVYVTGESKDPRTRHDMLEIEWLEGKIAYIRSKCAESVDAVKYTLVSLNLRSSRSTKNPSNIILAIPAGMPVRVIKTTGNWAQVQYYGITGYVWQRHLSKTKTAYYKKINTDIVDEKDVDYIYYTYRTRGTGYEGGIHPILEVRYILKTDKENSLLVFFFYYASEQDALQARYGINTSSKPLDDGHQFWQKGNIVAGIDYWAMTLPEDEVAMYEKVIANLNTQFGDEIKFVASR